MADAAAAAVDLILARRAWAVVVRDNDCDNNVEGGNPPVPNDAAASGSGDYDNVSSRMQSGGGTTDGEGGGQYRRNDDDAEEGGHIIDGTTTKVGAVALSGGRSRACVDFGHRRGRLRRQHWQSSKSAIVTTVD